MYIPLSEGVEKPYTYDEAVTLITTALVSKVYEFGHGRVQEHLGGIYEFLESKKMESLHELEKKN